MMYDNSTRTKHENLFLAAFLLLNILPLVVLEPHAPLWKAEQPLHPVHPDLALQDVAHDHVARRVHVVPVSGGDAVPGGEAQLPRQLVHLVICHASLVSEGALVGQKNSGDLCLEKFYCTQFVVRVCISFPSDHQM